MSCSKSIPDINKAVAFKLNKTLSNASLTTNEQTVKQIDIVTREIRQEIFDSFETIYHPDCPTKQNLKHCRQITETFDEIKENILENIVSFKSKLLDTVSKSYDKLDFQRIMSQPTLFGCLNSRDFRTIQNHLHSDNDLSSSILSVSSEKDQSISKIDFTQSDYQQSYGVRLARSIQCFPKYYHISASSNLYICGKSESSPDLSSISTTYQTAFSHFSKNTASWDNLDSDSESSSKSVFCYASKNNMKLGFSLIGDNPVRVESVKYGYLGWDSGLQTGDIIKRVNGFDVRNCSRSLIAKLIKNNSDINIHVQRERKCKNKTLKTKSAPDMTKQFATTLTNVDFNEECIESIDEIYYESLSSFKIFDEERKTLDPHSTVSLDFSGASIIKTQIDLCESMWKKKEKFKSHSKQSLINIMSGLPPTGQKVSTRSKTASFKRPISCDISDTKKEKGLFSKLKKGSSNSRLDEESQYRQSNNFEELNPNNQSFHSLNNNIPKKEYHLDKIQGRNFDSDDDDYELYSGETEVTRMEKLYDDINKVLKNPALVGYLLTYLLGHNISCNNLLFYFIVQHYKSSIHNKELQKEHLRIINEINTTFLHEKSILKLEHTDCKAIVPEELKNMKDHWNVFDEHAKVILSHCIASGVEKIKTSIAHGLYTVDVRSEKMTFDEKMECFNNHIKSMVKNLELNAPRESNQSATKENKEEEQNYSDKVLAIKISLASMYFYFSKKDKDDNSDNVSMVSSKLSSLLGKSTESLSTLNNCTLDKQPIFCAKIHKKPSGPSFMFKKKNVTKGHNFQEKSFEYPAECMVCEKLLWGLAPQGLFCQVCGGATHRHCKEFVKINCHKDSGRYHRNSGYISQPVDDKNHKTSTVEEKVISETNIAEAVETRDSPDKGDIHENHELYYQNEHEHISEDGMQGSISSLSSDHFQNNKPPFVISTATIIVTNNDKTSDNKSETESVDNLPEIYYQDKHQDRGKSEKSSASPMEKSHVKSMANRYDQKSIPRSLSDNALESNTLPRSSKRGADSVSVQDLIPDVELLANDPDMNVGETFEADKELEAFPDHLTKEKDKAEYTRLLVLMEFHHKTRFTTMNLKLIKHYLIRIWPSEETFLFKTLSLNCIEPLINLMKSLAETIGSCINKETYTSDTAQKVYEWFTDDNEANYEIFLQHSINLCCTNSLTVVKNAWKDALRTDPKFQEVLTVRHNKQVMVEQLSNMRPLLFNFPLILKKLVRDLNKFSKFKEEAKVWEKICQKFKLLPAYIDEHCMPLVQLINNGTIINGIDRTSWMNKLTLSEYTYNYVLDFPKTVFHHKLFDSQEVIITDMKESGLKSKAQTSSANTPSPQVVNAVSAINLKNFMDSYVIAYEDMMVFLQKENDKYCLKQFKASDSKKYNPCMTYGSKIHGSQIQSGKSAKNQDNRPNSFSFPIRILFLDQSFMVEMNLKNKDIAVKWVNFVLKYKGTNPQATESFRIHNGKPNEILASILTSTTTDDDLNETRPVEDEPPPEAKPRAQYDDLLKAIDNVKNPLNDFISVANSLTENENDLHQKPINNYELLLGTLYDISKMLKISSEKFYDESLDELSSNELFDQLYSLWLNVENRRNYIKNNPDKDTVSINDIDLAISVEEKSQSIDHSSSEFMNQMESEEPVLQDSVFTAPDINQLFADEIPSHLDNSDIISTDLEIQSTGEIPMTESLVSASVDIASEENTEEMETFANDFVNKIIYEAQEILTVENSKSKENSDSDNDCINNTEADLLHKEL